MENDEENKKAEVFFIHFDFGVPACRQAGMVLPMEVGVPDL